MKVDNQHIPVLVNKVLDFVDDADLSNTSKLTVFDGTLGGGGYTKRLLQKGYQVVACDLDPEAIELAERQFSNKIVKQQLTLVQDNFSNLVSTFPDNSFRAIIADLGFSSNQLENSHRGFSYLKPKDEFDLRFDKTKGKKAWEKICRVKTVDELKRIVYKYSGEQFSGRIAQNLFQDVRVRYRSLKNWQQESFKVTVEEVVDSVERAIPQKFMNKRYSILSRFWQAMRIWVNNEFESLERFLVISCDKLEVGGRLIVVCFHSLEDKIVTHFMRETAKPVEIDEFGNKISNFKFLTKKAILPSEEEIQNNPRSRSALLRVLEKTGQN
jgi:16S rRNA (cytosine1402-N4)-methyltransferase